MDNKIRDSILKKIGKIVQIGIILIVCSAVAVGQGRMAQVEKNSVVYNGIPITQDAAKSAVLNKIISMKVQDVPLLDAVKKIAVKANLEMVYNSKLLEKKNRSITASLEQVTVEKALWAVLKDTGLRFAVSADKQLVLLKRKETKNSLQRVTAATQETITGTVTDAQSGEPLPGVNILVKGTSIGASTDQSGNFELEAPSLQDTLVVSFIGYQSQEMPINGRTEIGIQLTPEAIMGEEMVVVGYGNQKKANLTSSISSVSSEEITTTTHSSLAQSLQGKIPGLRIRQQDGEPGKFASSINIRGFGEPLYVIDGVVRDGGVDFQQLNPNDIESITVLKDASAAVYGLDAANGVILVTTKKGVAGKPTFNYSGTVGVQVPTDVPEMSTAAQYLEMYNDAVFFREGSHYISQEELENWRSGGPGYESTDWYNETFRGYAPQMKNNFSVRGGSEIVDYYVSLGTFGEGGLLESKDMSYSRYNFRGNLGIQLTDNLKADVSLAGKRSEREYPGGDGFIWIYKGTIISLPTEQPYINGNTDYPAAIQNLQNPVLMGQQRYAGYTNNENKDFTSSVDLTWGVPYIEGLEAKAKFSYDSRNMFNKNVWKNYRVYSEDLTPQTINPPRIANAIDNASRVVFQGQLTYEKSFNEAHNINAIAVFEQRHYEKKYSYLKREYDFFTTDIVDFAGGLQTNSGNEVEEATMSYIGRLNYDFKGKYLTSISFRHDGSYRYAPGNRWAFFPTASVGWRISEENFIKENLPFLGDLKIRASYGKIGENVGSPFQHVLGFNPAPNQGAEFSNGDVTGGLVSPGIINPDFTWVESTVRDVGLEASLFNNKISFEADYYERLKTGLLKTREGGLPNTFGGDMPVENLESELTRGFEFIVDHQNSINEFQYGISANMNLARTKYKEVDKPAPTSSWDRWRNGFKNRWKGKVWGYERIGQFQNEEEIIQGVIHGGSRGNEQILPGDYKYKDLNGDGIINGKDTTPIYRNRTPKLFYGFTLNANYKNFDLTTVFQGAALYSIRFNEVYSLMFFNDGNVPAYFHDRWHLENPYDPNSEWVSGRWPASRFSEDMQSSYRESDAWRMRADYLRMKSIELGYTIPADVIGQLFLDRVRIYVNAHNLLTFTDPFLKQFDPEKYEGDYHAGYNYPLTQGFNFGLNVTF